MTRRNFSRKLQQPAVDPEVVAESLTAFGTQVDADEVDAETLAGELRGEIERSVPRAHLVECAECEERFDREADACPFCGKHAKETLFVLTDAGNAERLAFLHGERLRYCAALGGWLVYDGRRWARDDTGEVERLALRSVRNLYGEVEHVAEADEIIPHVRRSESTRGVLACVRLAQSHEDLAARAEDFDRDPWLLNVQNGVLDLRTRDLRPHDPNDLLTKVTACAYDPGARSELWERVVHEAMGGDAEGVAFLRRWFGYCLTGSTREEKLALVHGPGGTAKSTIVESHKRALGDYAMTADFETFVSKHGSGARNDIARLAGARIVSSIEVERGRRLAEGVVKSVTGGDDVTARFLFREAFSFTPQFKLVLVANDAPAARDDDSGLWRRILRIPFEHVVPEGERDPSVKARLSDPAQSGAAILAWSVEGCAEWQRVGLAVPKSISDATESYRQANDPLSDFLTEECAFDPVHHLTRAKLRERYLSWCSENGVRTPLSPKEIAERLRARGVEERKWRGERRWVGLCLTADVPDVGHVGHVGGHEGAAHVPHEPSAEDTEKTPANVTKGGAMGHVGHENEQGSNNEGSLKGGMNLLPPRAPCPTARRGRRVFQ